jgi:hypothetical protein
MARALSRLSPDQAAQPWAEAVSRLAGIRHALRLVDALGDGPETDGLETAAITAGWNVAGAAKRRCFDNRSAGLVGATAAGVEALLVERREGREPHVEASRLMVDQIRRELASVSRFITG